MAAARCTSNPCAVSVTRAVLQVYDAMRSNVTKGAAAEEQWNAALATYKQKYPKEAEEFEGLIK